MTAPVASGARAPEAAAAPIGGRDQLQQLISRFRADRWATTGLAMAAALAVIALAAPLFAMLSGHGPNQLFPGQLSPQLGLPTGPGSRFFFGVDQDGRDVFVRCLYGLRTSLLISLLAAAIATAFGVTVGLAAGYFGGWVDTLISRWADIFLALPVILFAISISSVCAISARGCLGGTIQPGIGLVVIILALFTWPYIARIVRGQTLVTSQAEFVNAARGFGASHLTIMFREILPNLTAQVIVYMTLIIPGNILFEAALSFLGVGVPQSTPSLGRMIADATAGSLFTYAWWMMLFPGVLLLLITFSFNIIGDGLRDAIGG
ncbi:MAG TPA: ABC transporter permease [Streptosporangiaceae bacterium]|jgi:ABC-type dipeptide/oligopeptide/nickel transport system permease subunit